MITILAQLINLILYFGYFFLGVQQAPSQILIQPEVETQPPVVQVQSAVVDPVTVNRSTQPVTPAPQLGPRPMYDLMAFGDAALNPEAWVIASVTDDPFQPTVLWEDDNGAIVFLVQYAFGAPEELKPFFGGEAFLDSIWGAYVPYEIEAQCTAGTVTLYEMTGFFGGEPYVMRYWVHPLSATSARTLSIVYPQPNADGIGPTSERFYPDFAECPHG